MTAFESTPKTVAVLGGRGFIGASIVRALRANVNVNVRSVSRTLSSPSGIDSIERIGDIRDIQSIREAVRGADSVVHAASYIGYGVDECRRTNVLGTHNVVEACRAEGVVQLLYISTAAVYGNGPHCGAKETELAIAPESTLSRSRAVAEQIVFDAGGGALRPHLVYGAGDRWFVPAVLLFAKALNGLVDHGRSLMSVIHVDDLAAAAAALSIAEPVAKLGPLNATDFSPVSMNEVLSEIYCSFNETDSLESIKRGIAHARAAAAGYSARQYDLLTTDHWYDSSKLRSFIPHMSERGFSLNGSDLEWYRQQNRVDRTPRSARPATPPTNVCGSGQDS